MRSVRLIGLLCVALAGRADRDVGRHREAPRVIPNANIQRAGVLPGATLEVTLEAKTALWALDCADRPPMTIEAFAEPGKAPLVPGPFLGVPAGTTIHLSIINSLSRPLTLFVPASIRGAPAGSLKDSVVVAPGTTRPFVINATVPGNYVYSSCRSRRANGSRQYPFA